MNLLQAIRGRRAVRDFTQQPVSQECLHQLVSAASWAPSAMNEQPWHFTVITDGRVLDEISERAKLRSLVNMPEVLHPAHFRDLMADPSCQLFHHAPAVVVISVPADLEWAREDCAAAAQNLMLAAVEMGLGTCWIGFAQDWLASTDGRKMLNLAQEKIVVAAIAVGHPRAVPPAVPRKAVALSWIGNMAVNQQAAHSSLA
jgi:nitroreductase